MTAVEPTSVASSLRLKLAIRGAVQGVGFRPFVYRLANELGLTGWVKNSPQGVCIEIEGARAELEEFRQRLGTERPHHSSIQSCEATWLDALGYDGFGIRESESNGSKCALIMPDIATCPDCLRELIDPQNRRYRYPFTNCTHCGPRFSIIEALPYDRANTSMKSFLMCSACQSEYDDPHNRRFHAQPNACPVCGPRLEFWNANGNVGHINHEALLAATKAIRRGQIVAVKGIGGFHLLVNARDDAAVRRLRERKHREEKPLALMFPSLESVKEICEVSPLEERLLLSPEAPIVLLRRLDRPHPNPLPQERENNFADAGKGEHSSCIVRPHAKPSEAATARKPEGFQERADCCSLSPGERVRVRASVNQTGLAIALSVAPGNPNLGVMLPSNPLHHLLMAELGFIVVATSGNLSDEPICTDEFEALERLHDIAEVLLVHNRPIVRHMDDSIVRVMLDREMVVRRARGYAPRPINLKSEIRNLKSDIILAVGGHFKNSVALAVGEQVFISQHIGDLDSEPANQAFRRLAADLPRLYDAQPEIVAADLHPDYLSTKYAKEESWTAPAERSDDGALEAAAATVESSKAVSRFARHRSPRSLGVQHHIAHVLSCIAENEVELPAMGVAWDGTGYGTDGTIWGGEFFLITEANAERVASLRPFRLPGGDAAVKEPRRAVLGLLHELANSDANLLLQVKSMLAARFSPPELAILEAMLLRGVNSPSCSSIGRLFDAAAALLGLRQQMQFEGQAAMELEFATEGVVTDATYELPLTDSHSPMRLDWTPMIAAMLVDVAHGVAVGEISAKFHNTLAEGIVTVANRVGERRVALSGGCFQNRYLTERVVTRLRAEGFQPYWHQRVPPNDGGIALGQIVAARRLMTHSRVTHHASR